MNDYIERKRAIVDACNSLDLYPSEYADLEDALNRIPAADVAPVVRCRDCEHMYEMPGGRFCAYGACVDSIVPDEFYCAYGKLKDGGTNGSKD